MTWALYKRLSPIPCYHCGDVPCTMNNDVMITVMITSRQAFHKSLPHGPGGYAAPVVQWTQQPGLHWDSRAGWVRRCVCLTHVFLCRRRGNLSSKLLIHNLYIVSVSGELSSPLRRGRELKTAQPAAYKLACKRVCMSAAHHSLLTSSLSETNLKVRQPLPETAELEDDTAKLGEFNGETYMHTHPHTAHAHAALHMPHTPHKCVYTIAHWYICTHMHIHTHTPHTIMVVAR